MHNIRITVALELSDLDQKILEYTAFICKTLPVEKVYFLHVAEHLELPASFVRDHPELNTPEDEQLEDQMKKQVTDYLSLDREIPMDFDAVQGKVMEELIEQSKIKLSNLLIVGKPDLQGGSGFKASRLARHSACSVLFVPEIFDLNIRNIMVPVDFSEHSKLAAEVALTLSKSLDSDVVHLVNIYTVPEGYYRLGETYEEASAVMCNYAKEDYKKFSCDLEGIHENEVRAHFIDPKLEQTNLVIKEKLQEFDCQLLVMGSKGRTDVAAMFMGSLTEKLIQEDLGMPIMVIKKRQENMGFLDALLKIGRV